MKKKKKIIFLQVSFILLYYIKKYKTRFKSIIIFLLEHTNDQ